MVNKLLEIDWGKNVSFNRYQMSINTLGEYECYHDFKH